MHSEKHFFCFRSLFFILLLCTKWFFYPKTSCCNCRKVSQKRVFFWGFHPLFQPLFISYIKLSWFFWKNWSKFEYSISKIGKSPPKSGSSFSNWDPFLQILVLQPLSLEQLLLTVGQNNFGNKIPGYFFFQIFFSNFNKKKLNLLI